MKRISMILALALAAAFWAATACDGSDGDGDVDADVDGDADAGTGDWRCTPGDVDRPAFRITSLRMVEPEALSTASIQLLLDNAVDGFDFVWLFDLDLTAGTMQMGVGSAATIPPTTDDDFCNLSWNDPVRFPLTDATITVEGDRVETASPVAEVPLLLYSEEDPDNPLAELPVVQMEVALQMSTDRALVGFPGDDRGSDRYASDWLVGRCSDGTTCQDESDCSSCATQGTMVGWVTLEDVLAVPAITAMDDQTLCGLLSGDVPAPTDHTQDCTTEPQSDWPRPPETIPGSSDVGWRVEAVFGAAAVTISG